MKFRVFIDELDSLRDLYDATAFQDMSFKDFCLLYFLNEIDGQISNLM
jgi:hypothetical protein